MYYFYCEKQRKYPIACQVCSFPYDEGRQWPEGERQNLNFSVYYPFIVKESARSPFTMLTVNEDVIREVGAQRNVKRGLDQHVALRRRTCLTVMRVTCAAECCWFDTQLLTFTNGWPLSTSPHLTSHDKAPYCSFV